MSETYEPPKGNKVGLNFTEPYTPPLGSLVGINFTNSPDGDQEPKDEQFLHPTGFDSLTVGGHTVERFHHFAGVSSIQSTLSFGAADVWNYNQHIQPAGKPSSAGYGKPGILNLNRYLSITAGKQDSYGLLHIENSDQYLVSVTLGKTDAFGLAITKNINQRLSNITAGSQAKYGQPSLKNLNRYLNNITAGKYDAYGKPEIKNVSSQVWALGFAATIKSGSPIIYNLNQHIKTTGFTRISYGSPTLLGGLKDITVKGSNYLGLGRPTVIDPRADQEIKAKGYSLLSLGKPDVNPKFLRPVSFNGKSNFGTSLVYAPELNAVGWPSSVVSNNTYIGEKSQYIDLLGFDNFEDFPKQIRDRAINAQHVGIIETTIFGDILVNNLSRLIELDGFDNLAITNYHTIVNTRRPIELAVFGDTHFGSHSVVNEKYSVYTDVFDAHLSSSNSAIGYRVRYVEARGVRSGLAFGNSTLIKTPEITPTGYDAARYGQHRIEKFTNSIDDVGLGFTERHGSQKLTHFSRILKANGIAIQPIGQQKIEHRDKTIALASILGGGIGSVSISSLNKFIHPLSIYEQQANVHRVERGERFILAWGFDMLRFGERIIPHRDFIYPQGFVSEVGHAGIENRNKTVRPNSVQSSTQLSNLYGNASLYSTWQYIALEFDHESELEAPLNNNKWTHIFNANRTIGATGTDFHKLGVAQIANTGRVIEPEVIYTEQQLSSDSMIAFAIREVRPEPIESPYMNQYTILYNTAREVFAGSVGNSASWGVAHFELNRKAYKFQGWEITNYGQPMISHYTRELSLYNKWHEIAPPVMPLPVIDLYTRYIDPDVYSNTTFGRADVVSIIRKIKHGWSAVTQYGDARVWNLTPELRQRGITHDEHGTPAIRNEWEDYAMQGDNMQVIYRPVVAFRDRKVSVRGLDSLRNSRPTVQNVYGGGAQEPEPFVDQFIYLYKVTITQDGEVTTGYGIEQVDNKTARPSVKTNVIRMGGLDQSSYGRLSIHSNGLLIEYGINEEKHGKPEVTYKNRTVSVEGEGIASSVQFFYPRMSPHTIWAVKEPPTNALSIWQEATGRLLTLRYVDEVPYVRGPEAILGKPKIANARSENTVRSLRPSGRTWSAYGTARVQNKDSQIQTIGFNSYLTGFHSIPSDIEVEQVYSTNFALYGKPIVARPPYIGPQEVKAGAIVPANFGANRIDLYHRTITANGFDSMRLGTRKVNDTPYMWQGLRLGPNIPMVVGGLNASSYGNHNISFLVRGVEPKGNDYLMIGYDYESFESRMFVRNRLNPENDGSNEWFALSGWDDSSFGVADIRPRTRYITPDGNSDQHRKGAPNV